MPIRMPMPEQANQRATMVIKKLSRLLGSTASNKIGAVKMMISDTMARCRPVVSPGINKIDAAGTPLIF